MYIYIYGYMYIYIYLLFMLIFGVVGPIVSFYHIRSSSKVGIGRCSKSHLLLSAQASALFQMGNLENHGTMNCPGKSMVLRRHRACFFWYVYPYIYINVYIHIYIWIEVDGWQMDMDNDEAACG